VDPKSKPLSKIINKSHLKTTSVSRFFISLEYIIYAINILYVTSFDIINRMLRISILCGSGVVIDATK